MPAFDSWLSRTRELLTADLPRLVWVGLFYALLTVVEYRWPAQKGQRFTGRLRNLVHAAIFIVLGMAAWSLVLMQVLALLPGASRADEGLWASLMSCAASLLALDFFYYWYHRAQHTLPALWAIHELHHADTELNVTTSMRTYWLELPLQAAIVVAPALWLVRMDETALALLPVFTTGFLLFTHANVGLRLGVLTPIFCGPQVHRIHHSLEPGHENRNFAQFFPVYDVLFGTYCAPGREVPRTGTQGLPSDVSHLATLARPFKLWMRTFLAR